MTEMDLLDELQILLNMWLEYKERRVLIPFEISLRMSKAVSHAARGNDIVFDPLLEALVLNGTIVITDTRIKNDIRI